MVNVIVADDHNLVRQGICALLEKTTGLRVVGQASDGREVVSLVKTLAPDLVIMDVSMPNLDGVQAVSQIFAFDSAIRIIMLSMYSKTDIVQRVLQQGVQGYLLKSSVSEELNLAIEHALRGEVYLSPDVVEQLERNFVQYRGRAPTASAAARSLTHRENEVLQLIAEGHTNSSIANQLGISTKTVEKHRASLMRKLDVADLPALIRTAIKRNLIFNA